MPIAVVVESPTEDALLAVPVSRGVAELARTVLLRGAARRLYEEHGGELTREAAVEGLLSLGAGSRSQAEADAEGFLAALRVSGLAGEQGGIEEVAPTHRGPARGEAAPATPLLEADDLEHVAREVLARGLYLRYRAFGRSMGGSIPSGSTLEVEARPFERIRRGEVALYSAGEARLVAHRVVGRRGGRLLLRGDTCARLDTANQAQTLGVVRARIERDGTVVPLSTGPRRWAGLATGTLWRAGAFLVRNLVVQPLRASSFLRSLLWGTLRLASGLLLRVERFGREARRPLDVARSALLTEAEKDRRRRALYERRSVQSFTSLEENVRAGLTLIEEVILRRHPLEPGRALVLGCGPGRECLALARMGFDVTGVDREEGMLRRARELAQEERLPIRYVAGEAVDAATSSGLADASFDLVVVFSGLYNMVLPRARRVALLSASRARLVPGGRVLLTFLSAYLAPEDAGEPAPARGFWSAITPDHEPGDLYLLNEAVHVFPRGEDVSEEARAAGLEVLELWRDQRAYDRADGKVRGYAILRRPPSAE